MSEKNKEEWRQVYAEKVARGRNTLYYGWLHYEVCSRVIWGSNVCDCDRIDLLEQVRRLEADRTALREALEGAEEIIKCIVEASGWDHLSEVQVWPKGSNRGHYIQFYAKDWLARLDSADEAGEKDSSSSGAEVKG